MTKARDYTLKIDASQVVKLGERLAQASGEEIGRASVTALNEVVDRTYDLARDRMIAGINLSDDYLRRRMTFQRATPGKPVASITASGARNATTVLGCYDAKPVIVANNKGRPGKGNKALGIPSGQKQVGVTVEVTRGQTSDGFVPRGFLLPLNRGTESGGNGFGVFARSRDGKLRHRYGPSVYQLFAYQVERIVNDVTDDLEDTLAAQVDLALQKAIEP
ncbi:phage tail protein [Ralstonia pseudosolanacearum]|uniref:phage tail protein n=1 Tax=Ralstonia pseudosolanacearum TaxID=1310165 RepID=UPI003D16C997